MAGHVVTAAAVRVVVGSAALIIERGRSLPEGVSADQIDHLTGKGLVAAAKEPEPKPEVKAAAKPAEQKK